MRKRDVVDHSLQRRALLHDMRTGGPFGTTTADDVCDASPYLKSAARALGEETARSCPVCHQERLWEVSWVYGDAIGDASGSARTQAQVGELAASRPDFAGYDVEVCLQCGWNHLVRSWRAGTAGMPPARRSRQARTGM